MASEESHILVACEESLLSYELFHAYFPLFTYMKLNVKSEKDSSLPKVLNKLSKNPNVSITIVTACPHPQLIEKYLRENVLTETPFSVVYVPLLPVYSSEEAIAQDKKINIVPASTSPPSGYTLIYNCTLPPPKIGWENYAKILWQRLQNIDFFCDMHTVEVENPYCQNAQGKAIIKPIPSQQKRKHLTYFNDSDENSQTTTRSPIRQIIEEERSPLRSSSPFART
jgi:hypothetical protein